MSFVARFLNRTVLLELGPTIVFFLANAAWGLMPATAAVMVATVVVVGLSLVLDGRVPMIAVATLCIVLVLGGASLMLNDETFIKLRPTVGNSMFALALAVGLFFKPSFLMRALGGQVSLTADGWRILTFCWIIFALSLAGLNELVWRNVTTDAWVTFKTALAPGALAGYVIITNIVARRFWDEEAEESSQS